jgi:D-cysteine desulfhydrase
MKQSLPYPGSIELARISTPLVFLERLSRKAGIELLCKRDDLTGAALSGNKVRKLEFLLSEALDQECDRVITCGGEQSNHARATAVAAARIGLGCHLLLRTADPEKPPGLVGNVLLDRLSGAAINWITPEEYHRRDELMAAEAKRLERTEEARVYIIPEGGSNALGAWGYVRCAEELAEQLGPVKATVVYPVGSGGTAAGLIAGCRMLDLPYRLIGVCVTDDRATFQRRIAEILDEMAQRYEIDVTTPPEQIEIWQDYVGLGYALSRDEELSLLHWVARLEGLLLDPVYTGKALFGLLAEIDRGAELQQPVVFLHTGGLFGLFDKAEQLGPLLGGASTS